jgi:hypothetical protein
MISFDAIIIALHPAKQIIENASFSWLVVLIRNFNKVTPGLGALECVETLAGRID